VITVLKHLTLNLWNYGEPLENYTLSECFFLVLWPEEDADTMVAEGNIIQDQKTLKM